jgi:hypothetical protein
MITIGRIAKKCPLFDGIWVLIAMFPRTSHSVLFWVKFIKSSASHYTYFKLISVFASQIVSTIQQKFIAFLTVHQRGTCPTHLIILNLLPFLLRIINYEHPHCVVFFNQRPVASAIFSFRLWNIMLYNMCECGKVGRNSSTAPIRAFTMYTTVTSSGTCQLYSVDLENTSIWSSKSFARSRNFCLVGYKGM